MGELDAAAVPLSNIAISAVSDKKQLIFIGPLRGACQQRETPRAINVARIPHTSLMG